MARVSHNHVNSRISTAFAARLKRLEPEQKVRAVLLLHKPKNGSARGRRQSQADRQATIEATRRSSDAALSAVDKILSKYGGRRLAAGADALGTLPVETTSSGLLALAGSKQVEAILEDQEISSVDGRLHE
jgi:hypothetical protein